MRARLPGNLVSFELLISDPDRSPAHKYCTFQDYQVLSMEPIRLHLSRKKRGLVGFEATEIGLQV